MSLQQFTDKCILALEEESRTRARLKPPGQSLKAPSGLTIESASADFHELRQGFSPPRPRKRVEEVDGRIGEFEEVKFQLKKQMAILKLSPR